jgi:hypothetical protein
MDDAKAMIRLLDADRPDEERAEGLGLFAWLIGSWDIEAQYWDHAGQPTGEGRGEWHFGWVLQGRAIQDVLIGPPLEEQRGTGAPAREYGSSFRLYDPRTDTWRVTWFAPVSGTIVDLTARRSGDEIVLDGREPSGMLDRWIFSDITHDAFVWNGHESADEGRTWPRVERMLGRRRGSVARTVAPASG